MNIMFYSASFQSIVIYTGHKIQLTLVKTEESDALEPVCRALGCCVCKHCLSTSIVCPASPSGLLSVVLSVDATVQVMPLPCPSVGAVLQSHVVLKGKR